MNPFNLFFQIVMVVVAVTIGFMYINPTIVAIGDTQRTTLVYNSEREKVAAVNEEIAKLVNDMNSVSSANKQALLRYVPDEIDSIAVMKDLDNIITQLKIVPKVLSYKGPETKSETEGQTGLQSHQFELGVDVTYNQLKKLLSALELNDYPLQVTSLTVTPDETGFLAVTINLSTFARQSIVPVETSNDIQI